MPKSTSGGGGGGGVMDFLSNFFKRDPSDPSPASQALSNPNAVIKDVESNDLDIRQSPGGSKFFSQYGLKIQFDHEATEKLTAFREQLASGMADLRGELRAAQEQLKNRLPPPQA